MRNLKMKVAGMRGKQKHGRARSNILGPQSKCMNGGFQYVNSSLKYLFLHGVNLLCEANTPRCLRYA